MSGLVAPAPAGIGTSGFRLAGHTRHAGFAPWPDEFGFSLGRALAAVHNSKTAYHEDAHAAPRATPEKEDAMRTFMRVTIPVQSGNAAIRDGRIQKLIQSHMEKVKPEAAYFFPEAGERTAMFVFDMTDSSQVAAIAERFFEELEAAVEFYPVMNADDLMKGLAASQS
jgi:hypothetical protein